MKKFSYPQPQPISQPPPENVIQHHICQKIEAAHAKRKQERLAAEAEEATMLKEMEERLEEEKQMEEVRPGPAGTAGPAVLNVNMNCKSFFLFWFN